jgi:hypothetical protein
MLQMMGHNFLSCSVPPPEYIYLDQFLVTVFVRV